MGQPVKRLFDFSNLEATLRLLFFEIFKWGSKTIPFKRRFNWVCEFSLLETYISVTVYAGADPRFQVRGGALKRIASSGGRRENVWGISCEKSRFYAKKSYFFQLRREARKFLGYFVWKITILRKQIIFFPILGGGARRVRPPLDPPLIWTNGWVIVA